MNQTENTSRTRIRFASGLLIIGFALQIIGLVLSDQLFGTLGISSAFVGFVLRLDKTERQHLWKRKR